MQDIAETFPDSPGSWGNGCVRRIYKKFDVANISIQDGRQNMCHSSCHLKSRNMSEGNVCVHTHTGLENRKEAIS